METHRKAAVKITRQKDAIVFVGGKEYEISKIIYDNGKFIGFEAEPIKQIKWISEKIKPKEDRLVIVRDKDGKEYKNHQWVGHAWYKFVRNKEGYDGWRTDVENIVS